MSDEQDSKHVINVRLNGGERIFRMDCKAALQAVFEVVDTFADKADENEKHVAALTAENEMLTRKLAVAEKALRHYADEEWLYSFGGVRGTRLAKTALKEMGVEEKFAN